MIKAIAVIAVAASVFSMQSAFAQNCASNFESEGVPLATAITYKSWSIFPSVDVKAALDRAHRAVLVEGFLGVRVDKTTGSISATQETSGSGRPQHLRIVVRKQGKGSRVDARFMVQPGQVAPEGPTRGGICRIIDAVAG